MVHAKECFFIVVLLSLILVACAEKPSPSTEKAAPEGKIIPLESIPPGVLEQECTKYPWPPDCSWIPQPQGKELCQKCKELSQQERPSESTSPLESAVAYDESVLAKECRNQHWPAQCEDIPVPLAVSQCKTCKPVEDAAKKALVPTDKITIAHLKNKPQFFPDIDFANTNVPLWYTEVERHQAKELFTRSYPPQIFGLLEPSPPYQTEALDQEMDHLKSLGVNTLTIFAQHKYKDGTYTLIPDSGYTSEDTEQHIINRIIKAKANGFAVDLTVLQATPFDQPEGHDLEQFLRKTRELNLHWARLAEDYHVEFFTPFSEFEGQYSLVARGNANPSSADFIAANEWERNEVVPEIRKVFFGQLIYKVVAGTMPDGASATGYDYFGLDFTLKPGSSPDQLRNLARQHYEFMKKIADRDNIHWLVGEFWVHHTCLRADPDKPTSNEYCPSKESTPQQVADYYTAVLEEYSSVADQRKSGFIFDAYVFPAQGIRGQPAEEVVRTYFTQ